MQRNLRITVEGKAYLVKVEYLDDPGVGATPVQAPPPADTLVTMASETAPAGAPVPAPVPPAPAPVVVTPAPAPSVEGGTEVRSPIAGVVSSVDVAVGDVVESGQQLLAIEAMKMNTYIWAPQAGRVVEILVQKSSSVRAGDTLARIA